MVLLQDGKKLEFLEIIDAIWLGLYWIMNVNMSNTGQLATLDAMYFSRHTNGERCNVYHV
jgi:alpha-galactosidase/6-phospho-beta-glucosidase family protein